MHTVSPTRAPGAFFFPKKHLYLPCFENIFLKRRKEKPYSFTSVCASVCDQRKFTACHLSSEKKKKCWTEWKQNWSAQWSCVEGPKLSRKLLSSSPLHSPNMDKATHQLPATSMEHLWHCSAFSGLMPNECSVSSTSQKSSREWRARRCIINVLPIQRN